MDFLLLLVVYNLRINNKYIKSVTVNIIINYNGLNN